MVSVPSALVAEDWTSSENVEVDEWAPLKKLFTEIVADPEGKAKSLVIRLNETPEPAVLKKFGLIFKVLDLMAYYMEVEAAQYYASAGRWTPPPHSYGERLIRYYQQTLNPNSGPYSNGVLQIPLNKFAKTLLIELSRHEEPRFTNFLRKLLNTKRDFWIRAAFYCFWEIQLHEMRLVVVGQSFRLESYVGYQSLLEKFYLIGKGNYEQPYLATLIHTMDENGILGLTEHDEDLRRSACFKAVKLIYTAMHFDGQITSL